MGRGILSGALWGVLVSVLVLSLGSLLGEQPPGNAPPAPPQTDAPSAGTAEGGASGEQTAAAPQMPAPEPESHDLSVEGAGPQVADPGEAPDSPQADTAPAATPRTGEAQQLGSTPATTATRESPRPQARGDAPVAPPGPGAAPERPETDDNASISTEPVQPATPEIGGDTGFGAGGGIEEGVSGFAPAEPSAGTGEPDQEDEEGAAASGTAAQGAPAERPEPVATTPPDGSDTGDETIAMSEGPIAGVSPDVSESATQGLAAETPGTPEAGEASRTTAASGPAAPPAGPPDVAMAEPGETVAPDAMAEVTTPETFGKDVPEGEAASDRPTPAQSAGDTDAGRGAQEVIALGDGAERDALPDHGTALTKEDAPEPETAAPASPSGESDDGVSAGGEAEPQADETATDESGRTGEVRPDAESSRAAGGFSGPTQDTPSGETAESATPETASEDGSLFERESAAPQEGEEPAAEDAADSERGDEAGTSPDAGPETARETGPASSAPPAQGQDGLALPEVASQGPEAPSAPRMESGPELGGSQLAMEGGRGLPGGDSGVTVNRSIQPPPAPEASPAPDDAAAAEAGEGPALERLAQPFEKPQGQPLMGVVLIDDGSLEDAPAVVAEVPYPVSVAIDSERPGAAAAARAYRERGIEVLALADLPENAQPRDVEVSLESVFSTLPQSLGLIDGGAPGLRGDRAVANQVMAVLASEGRGYVGRSDGLGMALRAAQQEEVPSVDVYRDLDSEGQDATVIRRFLDQAAFHARQQSGTVVLARVRPDTISALILWGQAKRADRVALAPISAILAAE